jgi:hypothetical protein
LNAVVFLAEEEEGEHQKKQNRSKRSVLTSGRRGESSRHGVPSIDRIKPADGGQVGICTAARSSGKEEQAGATQLNLRTLKFCCPDYYGNSLSGSIVSTKNTAK